MEPHELGRLEFSSDTMREFAARVMPLLVTGIAKVEVWGNSFEGDAQLCRAFLAVTEDRDTFARLFPEVASDKSWQLVQPFKVKNHQFLS